MLELAALMGLYIRLAIIWLIFAVKFSIMCAAKKLEVKPSGHKQKLSRAYLPWTVALRIFLH